MLIVRKKVPVMVLLCRCWFMVVLVVLVEEKKWEASAEGFIIYSAPPFRVRQQRLQILQTNFKSVQSILKQKSILSENISKNFKWEKLSLQKLTQLLKMTSSTLLN